MKRLLRFLLFSSLLLCATNLCAKSYKVLLCLNYGEYNQKYDTIIVENGKVINFNQWVAPTRTGYKFKGYYDSRDAENAYWHPTQYIDKDGKGVRKINVNRDFEKTLYAHWNAKKYVLTFYTSVGELEEEIGIRPESPNHNVVTQGENLKINIDVVYGSKIADRLWSQDIITIRPGYKFLSLYDAEGNGEEIYRVTDKGNSLSAVKGEYWDGFGTDGHWIKDLGEDGDTLFIYPHYDPKFEIVEDGDRINFFNNDIQVRDIKAAIDEDNKIWKASPLVLDITQYTGTIQAGPDMYDDLGIRLYDGVLAFNYLINHTRNNGLIEPNCLTYLSAGSDMWIVPDNVVRMKYKKCGNFVLTDRCRVKIPYSFTAEDAIYERDKGYTNADGAVNQAQNSHWGTLCLPFPITVNQSMVTLYVEHAVNDKTKVIQFSKVRKKTVEAGHPCVYKRDYGKSSKITIKGRNVVVPVNTTYSTSSESLSPRWYFIGTYRPLMFYGYNYKGKKLEGTEIPLNKNRDFEICYYKQDSFIQLEDNNGMYLYPYRAYFKYDGRFESNGKDFSIEIIDDDETGIKETQTDKSDKIYTLDGRQVHEMKEGQIYIVNGKKLLY